MIVYLPNIDRKAALIAGYELSVNPQITITPDQVGANWPTVAECLDVSHDGTAAYRGSLAVPTVEALVASCLAEKAAADERWAMVSAELDAAIVAFTAAMSEPLPAQSGYRVYDNLTEVGQVEGVRMPRISYPSVYDMRVGDEHRSDPRFAQLNYLKNTLQARVDAENAAIADAARPALIAAWNQHRAAAAEAAAIEAAAKEARIAARAAARLESGYLERETVAYNARRYGLPWCARVTGVKARGELVYEWGDSTARHGSAGLLRVACKPGEIIAWGQKDLRKPASSDHYILRMLEDGRMQSIDRTEAYRLLASKSH